MTSKASEWNRKTFERNKNIHSYLLYCSITLQHKKQLFFKCKQTSVSAFSHTPLTCTVCFEFKWQGTSSLEQSFVAIETGLKNNEQMLNCIKVQSRIHTEVNSQSRAGWRVRMFIPDKRGFKLWLACMYYSWKFVKCVINVLKGKIKKLTYFSFRKDPRSVHFQFTSHTTLLAYDHRCLIDRNVHRLWRGYFSQSNKKRLKL